MLLGTLEVDAQDGSVDPRAIDHSIIALALAPGVQLPLRMSGWYAVQCIKVLLRSATEVLSFVRRWRGQRKLVAGSDSNGHGSAAVAVLRLHHGRGEQ